ncbi:hypothetical protein MMC15_003053 [Xylographa vitiligo]|nr:hypothetical protein [Xylographa vitiligo]
MSGESYTTATLNATSANSIPNQTTAHKLSVYAVAGILLAVFGVCLLSCGIVFLLWRFNRPAQPRREMLSQIPCSELKGEAYEQQFTHFDPNHKNADAVTSELQRRENVWNNHNEATNGGAGPLQFHYELHDSFGVVTPPNHDTKTNANQWSWISTIQDAPPPASIPPIISSIYSVVPANPWNPEPETSYLLPQSTMAEDLTVFPSQWMSKQWTRKANTSDNLRSNGNAECVRSVAPGDPYNYSVVPLGRDPFYKEATPVTLITAGSVTQSSSAGISGHYTASSVVPLVGIPASLPSSNSQSWRITTPSGLSTNRLKTRPPAIAYSPLRPQSSSETKINLASSQQPCERGSWFPSQFPQFQQESETKSKNPHLDSVRGKRSTPPVALQLTSQRSKAIRRRYSEDGRSLSAVAEEIQSKTCCPPSSLPTHCYSNTASSYQYSPVNTSPSSAGPSGSSSRHSGSSFYTGITELTPTTPAISGSAYETTSVVPTSQSCVE